MAGTRRRIDNLVVEHGKVERQSQTDRVCGLHFAARNIECLLVRLLRVLNHICVCPLPNHPRPSPSPSTTETNGTREKKNKTKTNENDVEIRRQLKY